MIDNSFHLDYSGCRGLLRRRLAEPAPGRIQILTGPRQVGKTTLLLEIAKSLEGQAVYVAGDDPDAALPGFWERVWGDAEQRAQGKRAVLILDEVHLLPDWAARLKSHWDRVRRRGIPLHVVVSGSSSLRIGTGSRESLAGRFERLTLTHWSAAALSEVFRITGSEAAHLCVNIGTYPGAYGVRDDFRRWRAYVRDAIIEPAIGRDILALGVIRRPTLLRQVFAIAAGSPAQIVSLQKLQGQLQDPGALETVAHYLTLLKDAYLIEGLEKYTAREHRRRPAPPKLVALNNALLSAMHPQGQPDPKNEPARFGCWVENACLGYAVNQGQRVTYWREEPLEVDAVIEGSWGSWALEVKSGAFTSSGIRAVLEFSRRHPNHRPLIVTSPGGEQTAKRLGVPVLNWIEFLQLTPSQAARL